MSSSEFILLNRDFQGLKTRIMYPNVFEELNSNPFGSWNLLESTIDSLKNVESQSEEDLTCDLKYLKLIAEVQKKCKHQCNYQLSEVNLDCWNDFLILEEAEEINHPETKVCTKIEEAPLLAPALTSKLINTTKQDEAGVQEIIDILSKVNLELLQSSIPDAWKELKSLEDKRKLIKLLSAFQSCLSILCQCVLFPELKQEGNFYSVMEIIMPVIQWFEMSAISDLFIPLLAEGESLLVRETDIFKEFISKLSSRQKSDLVSSFITLMENSLNKNYLHVFVSILEEVPLKVSEIPRLVALLNRNIHNFKDDRDLGKILLIIVDTYSSSSIKSVSKELVHLCNNFKGVMRFRINTTLKKIV